MHAAKKVVFVLGLALAAAPSIGAAQERSESERTGLTRLGGYALVGGGVNDFTHREVKDRFDVGGVWHLRLGIGNRSYVGGELAYVGSARTANGAAPDLLSSGAEAVLRVQYPWERGSWLVEPFAFGGLGWSHLSLRDAPAGLKDSDEIGAVPVGAGVTLGYRRVLLDARFTYRATFGEDLALAAGGSTPRLDQWGATASIGYEF